MPVCRPVFPSSACCVSANQFRTPCDTYIAVMTTPIGIFVLIQNSNCTTTPTFPSCPPSPPSMKNTYIHRGSTITCTSIVNRGNKSYTCTVLFQAADLGLGPIPITSMRSNVVQFSTPWLDIPLSVVIRRGAGITSLGELLNQDKIRYGMSISGVAMRKFIVTREEPYRFAIWFPFNVV